MQTSQDQARLIAAALRSTEMTAVQARMLERVAVDCGSRTVARRKPASGRAAPSARAAIWSKLADALEKLSNAARRRAAISAANGQRA